MNLLVDTNIFLEVLLEQARSQDSQEFLAKTDAHNFFISDFSLHSIGVLLLKRKEADVFRKFVSDVVTRAGIAVARPHVNEMEALAEYAGIFRLDFDDAYQYTLASKYDLKIVSFDADFDRTTLGRSEPSAIV